MWSLHACKVFCFTCTTVLGELLPPRDTETTNKKIKQLAQDLITRNVNRWLYDPKAQPLLLTTRLFCIVEKAKASAATGLDLNSLYH